jgi:hypothetical protein
MFEFNMIVIFVVIFIIQELIMKILPNLSIIFYIYVLKEK